MNGTAATSGVVLAVLIGLIALVKWYPRSNDIERARKTLRKVEKLVQQIVENLNQVEIQAKRLLASSDSSTDSTNISAYYHFDSTGRKIPNKWDSYDVDSELQKLDGENDENRSRNSSKRTLDRLNAVEHEFEAVLSFLDTLIRGDQVIRAERKAIVLEINNSHLQRIDSLRSSIKAWTKKDLS